jgi:hypothetical protein
VHARDWSRELEESEFGLPFVVGREERERGGRRVVNFRDEVLLPRLDESLSQGLGIEWGDVTWDGVDRGEVGGEEEDVGSVFEFGMVLGIETGSLGDDEEGSLVSEGSAIGSLESDVSAADSDWTAFSEEAEGIEMFF